ncbi:DUF1592 domain-containing protein [Akkermansiaceae bacterium]|nr:DUF1592 domain-containing protein [Akkermansiaceae bacterium]MDA7891975.1 DUF1592 domain-containing protein [Akkermansiaceae bacterium]MDA7929933.1 DUF1592 domain-containing protein [Akkermansiaceae bacterium]MDB4488757.1 DUF1592 domain-containing protein [Akkermansiaceae bacterium]MDB4566556.1 DUF1592 domain-containing protein [Akkermansiaceae bacterium]
MKKTVITVSILIAHCCGWVMAEPIDGETKAFLEKRAPIALKLIEILGEEGREELEDARERAIELREMFLEEKEEHGEKWAEVILGLEAVEMEIEVLAWRFEEGDLDDDEGEAALIALLKKEISLRNESDRMEIERLHEEVDEIEEELEWRLDHPEEALRERFEETLRDLGFEEDEEEEVVIESWPVYQPAPKDREEKKNDLQGVTFDYSGDIRPILETYCFDCHDEASSKGDIDLESALKQTPLVRNRLLWENVAERVKMGDMPPKKKVQPSEGERLKLRAWLAGEIDEFDYGKVRNPGYLPPRRLTREEYNRTIRDLVGLDLRPADAFPMDFSGSSGFSNSANTLFLQTAHLDRYFTAADGVIDEVRANRAAWEKLVGDIRTPQENIERFMRRAFRRPVRPEEVRQFMERYQAALTKKVSPSEALAGVFKLVLISPHFLLRLEQSQKRDGDQPVGEFYFASRLSYFLWASTPDDRLLETADSGKLSDPKKRQAEVKRMLSDSRSLALGEIFAGEWLATDDVGPRIRKDPIENPWCTESLMRAMRAETAHFFHSLVTNNEPVARLIDARYTFLNSELARFYGIEGVEGKQMRRVDLESPQRGGVLGQASVLATTSFPDRTSPVVRGKWILDTLLGTPPPPPPPNVPEIDVDGEGRRGAMTLRRKLEAHRESARCAGCHAQMDPLGFGLESYAEFGQWRGRVDDRGTLPSGARFRGPAGLKLALLDERLDDLGLQVIRKMLSYALGRQLEFYDEATVREIASRLKPGGYRLGDVVMEITQSYPFTMKRLPANPNKSSNEE